MKIFTYLLVLLASPMIVFCQDITGVWKGTMFNESTQQSSQYEVVISKDKGKYTAFSYSSYSVNENKYYGIKKINVRIAKDGKIVMQDAQWIENNYPIAPTKNIYQLNVLDFANSNDQMTLNGEFVTNATKEFHEHTGRINVKRVSAAIESDLLSYFKKPVTDNSITAVKTDNSVTLVK